MIDALLTLNEGATASVAKEAAEDSLVLHIVKKMESAVRSLEQIVFWVQKGGSGLYILGTAVSSWQQRSGKNTRFDAR